MKNRCDNVNINVNNEENEITKELTERLQKVNL
jgi:hypothetical protein